MSHCHALYKSKEIAPNKELMTGIVPVNKELLTQRVPVNNLFLFIMFGYSVNFQGI